MIGRIAERKREFERELSEFQRKMFRATLFLLKFSALSLPVYLLVSAGWNPVWLRNLNAELSSYLLRLLGMDVSVSGHLIHSGKLLLDVSTDSTGWKSVMALSALILSAEAGKNSKISGILKGTFLIFLVNVLRISSMVFLVNRFSISYELIHTVLWRWGLTAVLFVYWVHWFRSIRQT